MGHSGVHYISCDIHVPVRSESVTLWRSGCAEDSLHMKPSAVQVFHCFERKDVFYLRRGGKTTVGAQATKVRQARRGEMVRWKRTTAGAANDQGVRQVVMEQHEGDIGSAQRRRACKRRRVRWAVFGLLQNLSCIAMLAIERFRCSTSTLGVFAVFQLTKLNLRWRILHQRTHSSLFQAVQR